MSIPWDLFALCLGGGVGAAVTWHLPRRVDARPERIRLGLPYRGEGVVAARPVSTLLPHATQECPKCGNPFFHERARTYEPALGRAFWYPAHPERMRVQCPRCSVVVYELPKDAEAPR